MDPTEWGKTGGAGLLGAVLGFFGGFLTVRTKVNTIEDRMDKLSTSVRYTDTCDKMYEAVLRRLESIEGMQGEHRADLKEVLRRLPK